MCQPRHGGEASAEARSPRARRRSCLELARRAYRGTETEDDLGELLAFYDSRSKQRGFEAGIQTAIERLLSSPKFLFRIERNPHIGGAGLALSADGDIELASRLSFFLWSSIPDDELLEQAEAGKLSKPKVYEAQVARMLADPKAGALVDNFAGQWLYLRNLDGFVPNSVGFPNFDDNLRQGLTARDRALLREHRRGRPQRPRPDDGRLHVPERARREALWRARRLRAALPASRARRTRRRWGLLGKGSVLMVSSHTDRTSPVVRGKWVLENVLGTPPPAPPADVPLLEEIDPEGVMTFRQKLEAHRANPACAGCHAIDGSDWLRAREFRCRGRLADHEKGAGSAPIDSSGRLTDGTMVTGAVDAAPCDHEGTRAVCFHGGPKAHDLRIGPRAHSERHARRSRASSAKRRKTNYRFSSVVLAIAESVPFRMRKAPVESRRSRASDERGVAE